MSIEGQGHIFSIYFPGFLCFVFYLAKISGERLQDHWSSGSGLPLIRSVIKHAGKVDVHNILDEFEFRPDRTTNVRVSCL